MRIRAQTKVDRDGEAVLRARWIGSYSFDHFHGPSITQIHHHLSLGVPRLGRKFCYLGVVSYLGLDPFGFGHRLGYLVTEVGFATWPPGPPGSVPLVPGRFGLGLAGPPGLGRLSLGCGAWAGTGPPGPGQGPPGILGLA